MLEHLDFELPYPRKRKHVPEALGDFQAEISTKRQLPVPEVIVLIDDHESQTSTQKIPTTHKSKRTRSNNRGAQPHEAFVVEDDNVWQVKGSGSAEDPITFLRWFPNIVIDPQDDGVSFVISDDEDDIEWNADQHSLSSLSSRLLDSSSRSPIRGRCSSISSSTLQTGNHLLASRADEQVGANEKNHILIEDDIDGLEYVYSQDWSTIKQEPGKEAPSLDDAKGTRLLENSSITHPVGALSRFPQEHDELLVSLPVSNATASSREDEQRSLELRDKYGNAISQKHNILKKRLFYEKYGPRILPQLRKRLTKYRNDSEVLDKSQCWLYRGPVRTKQGTLEISVTFYDEDDSYQKYRYQVNAGFISLMVDGLLTEEFKQGIIEHRWHASHLCGNWTCTNPHHLTAEPGSLNTKRNSCLHGKTEICVHFPKCLSHLNIQRRTGGDRSSQTDIPESLV